MKNKKFKNKSKHKTHHHSPSRSSRNSKHLHRSSRQIFHNSSHKNSRFIEGVISVSARGTGYIKTDKFEDDIEVDARHLKTALNGDTVKAILYPKTEKRQTAEVMEIILRAKSGFAGVLEENNGVYFLNPDDTKMYTNILIPSTNLNGAKTGQKVFGKITSWEDPLKNPQGKIIKILGEPGDNNAEMHAIAIEKGFDSELSDEIHKEAEEIKKEGIKKEDYLNRRDFRKILTFTIDPIDAKDFDDAISFQKLSNEEYEIGIHIADVSHYVKIGSKLDEEAKERTTSVYLVDRTIPMLPEVLSNDLCSLIPHKDRLTMSAVFVLDKNAKIKNEWFGKTVINSQKRFTYEEAEETIKNQNKPLHKELTILNSLAKKLTKERFENGAISLDQEEVKFILDENGKPIKIIKKNRGDSNKLIEEFMLLANKKVAELIAKSGNKKGLKTGEEKTFIYRVHDFPPKEKMEDLIFFLKSLGYKLNLKNGAIPSKEINSLLEKIDGKSMEDTVHKAVIRSMAKATYSTKNIGHYGLAFDYYTHFTSPIRRYPDILVHRLLEEYLSKKKIGKEKMYEYEKMARKSGEQEKKASEAERASVKYKQVEYMLDRIGKKFDGIITGINERGIFVEEKETKCEGRVSVRDMTDDFYTFNERTLELKREKNKKVYRLGDKVKIKVLNANLEKKIIDYELI